VQSKLLAYTLLGSFKLNLRDFHGLVILHGTYEEVQGDSIIQVNVPPAPAENLVCAVQCSAVQCSAVQLIYAWSDSCCKPA